MTDKERLEDVKDILKSPGEVFFGSISEDGVVSQDVADAEPYFKWLIEQAEKNITCQEVLELQKDALKGLLEQNKRYREALEFYADNQTYTDEQHTSSGVLVGTGYLNILSDNGIKARKALEEKTDE